MDSDPASMRNAPSDSHPGAKDHKNDDYEVVEVDDEGQEAAPAPAQRTSSQTKMRPGLPRLNSKSRAPSSSLGARDESAPKEDTKASEPSPPSSPPDFTVPMKLRESREIPLDQYRVRNDGTTAAESSSPSPSPPPRSDSEGAESESTDEDAPTPRASPSLKAKDENDPPNPTIQIPKVTPLSSGLTLPPNLAELADGLEDKYVDEFGNILEWDGQVLGRVEGDLPAMIGRPVSATGEVMDAHGEVVGYVAENDTIPPRPPPPQPIQGMGDGLQVDHLGNILDRSNNVVGHFNGDHVGKGLQRSTQGGGGGSSAQSKSQNCSCHGQNPKPTAAPSPSEIYLDVKSTNDGVQLIIKIPTVFNGGGGPNIHIATS